VDAFGYLLINKHAGLTSFESLARIKQAFGTGKICHTGTLDKFAQGLLVVLVGRAVKLSPWFSACDKRYAARLVLGEETDTLDPEGNVVFRTAPCSREAFLSALPVFTGTILQAPPAYSAVHVGGRRAHALARSGAAPEMKKRPVTVYSLVLRAWEPPFADIEVHCSKGTYIRSLARDLGRAAGSCARLETLTRGAVGGFSLEGAVSAEELSGGELATALRPVDKALFRALSIPQADIDEAAARAFLQGRDLRSVLPPDMASADAAASGEEGSFAVFGPAGFAGMIERRGGCWNYGYVCS
jgi:tRNA pseudouridine55 synthase